MRIVKSLLLIAAFTVIAYLAFGFMAAIGAMIVAAIFMPRGGNNLIVESRDTNAYNRSSVLDDAEDPCMTNPLNLSGLNSFNWFDH